MEHLFDVETARKYGVNAAIVVRHLQFWVIKNKSNKKHLHDGRTWTYCSVKAFTKVFPYWSVRQMRVILDGLIEKGVILKGSYNPKGYDHTVWYAFQNEKAFVKSDKSICQKGQMERSGMTKPLVSPDKPIPNPITISLTDKSTDKGLSNSQAEWLLELDREIAAKSRLLAEAISTKLRPTQRERATFARVIEYLIRQCQTEKLKPSIFAEAVEWVEQAVMSTATNKKGLFVAKIKEQTGFRAQSRLLDRKSG